MKKFISMVMAAAMVVSLVPATAFAATGTLEGKTYVEGADTYPEEFKGKTIYNKDVEGFIPASAAAEVQFEIENVKANQTNGALEQDFTIELDGAKFAYDTGDTLEDGNEANGWDPAREILSRLSLNGVEAHDITGYVATWTPAGTNDAEVTVTLNEWDDTTLEFTLAYSPANGQPSVEQMFKEDDVMAYDLQVVMDGTDEGDVAMVSVSGDFAELTDAVFAEVAETGLTASIKKATDVAEETEIAIGEKIKVKSNIDKFVKDQVIELELTKGFEFISIGNTSDYSYVANSIDENEAKIVITGAAGEKSFDIPKDKIVIEAVDAKAGEECELTVKAEDEDVNGTELGFDATAEAIVIAVVCADAVIVSVDEDEDVPEMWSGVDAANSGLTTGDKEHWSLEVTVEENVVDAWDFKDAFDVTLTDGVFVTDVEITGIKNVTKTYADDTANNKADKTDAKRLFTEAYVKGDQESFEFGRKKMNAVDGEKAEISFKLELVAEPGFEGDVVLAMAEQEVTIATFKAPYTVAASANDVIIDYRNTEVPTEVVITEAEEGLWEVGTEFTLATDHMIFEDDATIVVNEDESDAEIKDFSNGNNCAFRVTEKSDDEAAVVTISDISLYMSRNLPAGAYDLELLTSLVFDKSNDVDSYMEEAILGAGTDKDAEDKIEDMTTVVDDDYTYVVKEGWLNVVTAGRDADDASFTTKVVVPVGESYIVAGEQTVALDVPAYVSASGYTMLPVRAVAVALGINTNNVLWDQATKTVTILYGQRIITMTVGSKAINVNGSAIPASASPEVVDGRTFLPMRDLATALGVTDITWDAATKTATLNGNK